MSCFLSGEPVMYNAYNNGKDLYAEIAASALNVSYEECLEFYPEGTELEIDGQKIIAGKKTHLNKQGKENRSIGKKLQLASTYGMGAATAGANMGKSAEEGQKLLDNFFKGFPKLKSAIDQSKEFLFKNCYVEDFLGRRRRLPEIKLPKYVVTLEKNESSVDTFNPIFGCTNRVYEDLRIAKWQNVVNEKIEASQAWQKKRAEKEGKTWTPNGEMSNKALEEIQKEAEKDGVIIQANTARIAQAERQCFNARIQGSAASLTKLAMVDIYNDEILNNCQAKLIIPVHDELLVECPAFYADIVEKRLPEVMINAAKKGGDDVPQSCDPYNVSRWYSDFIASVLIDQEKKLEHGDEENGILPMSKEAAFKKIIEDYPELPEQSILDVLHGKTEELIF